MFKTNWKLRRVILRWRFPNAQCRHFYSSMTIMLGGRRNLFSKYYATSGSTFLLELEKKENIEASKVFCQNNPRHIHCMDCFVRTLTGFATHDKKKSLKFRMMETRRWHLKQMWERGKADCSLIEFFIASRNSSKRHRWCKKLD